MNIEQVDINKIKPYEKNSRVHNDSHIKQVCKSIEEFGFVNPILVDKRFTIIAGHGRYMAAKKLGDNQIYEVLDLYDKAEDLSPSQQNIIEKYNNKYN